MKSAFDLRRVQRIRSRLAAEVAEITGMLDLAPPSPGRLAGPAGTHEHNYPISGRIRGLVG